MFLTYILQIRNLWLSDVKNLLIVPWLEIGRAKSGFLTLSSVIFLLRRLQIISGKEYAFLHILIPFILKLNFIVLLFGNRNLTRLLAMKEGCMTLLLYQQVVL